MSVKNAVNAIELASIASSAVTASYQAIDATGIEKACFLLIINNNSNQAITVSFDGVTDNEYIPATTRVEFNVQNNAMPASWVALWPTGTKVYVKGTAGTGNIYVSGLYVAR